jgi:hypothetical protein
MNNARAIHCELRPFISGVLAMSHPELIVEQLEDMVDAHNARHVIEALAEVCGSKADHIEENWQDKGLAKLWAHLAERLENAAEFAGKAGL